MIEPVENPKFTFIDLFAGIGGFRIALQNLEGKCVFSSEWDRFAQQSYQHNFGDTPHGDITLEQTKNAIPQGFNILTAGFPCQAFSIAGKRGGFEDTRGTLFFDVAKVIQIHQPEAIFLENVKGLRGHQQGKTLATILNTLRNDLGYYVPDPQIINARNFGVPQNRERIFIVGFRKDLGINNFTYPEPLDVQVTIRDIIEENPVPVRYYLSDRYYQTLENHRNRHASKGNGFGYQILDPDDVSNAIVVGGMGRERNLVIDHRIGDNRTPETAIQGEVNRLNIRRLTPRECARLQGFPENFEIVVSPTQAFKQFGNSVAVPAIQATANQMLAQLEMVGVLPVDVGV